MPLSEGAACVTFELDGIELNASMIWQDRNLFSPVSQTVTRTVAGNLVTFTQGLSKGRPITLVANQEQGWLTLAQVDAIQAIADVPGGVYTLQIDTDFFTVQFRHQEAPAFSAEPLIPRVKPLAGDYFEATIRLETV